MANHCIEVACPGCGHCYCLRGCGYEFAPDPEVARRKRAELEAGQTRLFEGERCPHCGEQMAHD